MPRRLAAGMCWNVAEPRAVEKGTLVAVWRSVGPLRGCECGRDCVRKWSDTEMYRPSQYVGGWKPWTWEVIVSVGEVGFGGEGEGGHVRG